MKTTMTSNSWNIPTVDGTLALDTKTSTSAEYRLFEVATVTAAKAPELLSTFNMAYLELSRNLANSQFEYNRAVRARENARATFMIDRLPNALQAKNLVTAKSPMGTEDIRSSLLRMDTDFLAAEELVDELKCVCSLLDGKMKSVEMAYTSVKKILGEVLHNLSAQPLGLQQQSAPQVNSVTDDVVDAFFR